MTKILLNIWMIEKNVLPLQKKYVLKALFTTSDADE